MVNLAKTGRGWTPRILIAVTWVPYLAIRCVTGTDPGCEMFPAAAHAREHSYASHDHSHDGHATHEHDEHGPKQPAGTCCELTEKCDIRLTAGPPSLDAPASLGTLPALSGLADLHCSFAHLRSAEIAQGPPIYIRHARLLL